MRQITSLAKSGINTPKKAEYAVMAILEGWQARSFPKLIAKGRTSPKKYHTNFDVLSLIEWIVERPFLEATFWLSSAYVVLAGTEQKVRFATYFTPPILADRLIDNLLQAGASLEEHVWMDPACGGGAFLTPVALRMAHALREKGFPPKKILDQIGKNLIGMDVVPALAEMSKTFINMALYKEISASNHFPLLNISISDSLLRIADEQKMSDVVICNPPYRKMLKEEVDRYRMNFKEIMEGQPNLYGLFIRQCIALGGPNAKIGLLTPTSYLSGKSFSKLRNSVLQSVHVQQLDLVRDKEGIFLGVEQETALSVFRKYEEGMPTKPASETQVYITNGLKFEAIGSCFLPENGVAWPVPRNSDDVTMLLTAGKAQFRLFDYGYSIRTGSYVYYRDERKTYKRRPTKKQQKTIFPLIWSSDVTLEGVLIHGRTSVEDDHPKFIDMGSSQHRSLVRTSCLALQRVTSADQQHRLISAVVGDDLLTEFGGVIGENHVIFLVPNSPDVLIHPSQLAKILRSQIVDRLFRCVSGSVNVSIFELEQLPLPCPRALSQALEQNYCIDVAVSNAYQKPSSTL